MRAMLHEFLTANHEELEKRCRLKSAARVHGVTSAESAYGVPWFIAQLVETLRAERAEEPAMRGSTNSSWNAGLHGGELLHRGFNVEQVVHEYGDLCQALTELAEEQHYAITVPEFHTFNRCLDDATADAVSAFTLERDQRASAESTATMNERLGSLAHELRNQLNTAMLAFSAIQGGSVAIKGATGAMLERSLHAIQQLVDRSLADVRLTAGLQLQRERVELDQLVSEIQIPVVMEAFTRELVFSSSVERDLRVDADRQMLGAALGNLLQNALKFTRPHGRLSLTAKACGARVIIDVRDECGGLPDGKTEQLFQPFEQHGANRSGLGLGLSISRRSIEANGGTLVVRNLPDTGCVFTIDLPAAKEFGS